MASTHRPPRARSRAAAATARRAPAAIAPAPHIEGPYVGALLRRAAQSVRERLLVSLAEHGFGDINQTHLSVFQYPPPEGVRATHLAHRASMTKQAMNYLLQQVET